jgi:hypothetical protein
VLGASIIRAASIISPMMEAANTSETSINVYQTTRRYNQEDRHLHPDFSVSDGGTSKKKLDGRSDLTPGGPGMKTGRGKT